MEKKTPNMPPKAISTFPIGFLFFVFPVTKSGYQMNRNHNGVIYLFIYLHTGTSDACLGKNVGHKPHTSSPSPPMAITDCRGSWESPLAA
jgi:hypothetical protein